MDFSYNPTVSKILAISSISVEPSLLVKLKYFCKRVRFRPNMNEHHLCTIQTGAKMGHLFKIGYDINRRIGENCSRNIGINF